MTQTFLGLGKTYTGAPKPGSNYPEDIYDWKKRIIHETGIHKKLGLQDAQLIANPQLASDAAALAKYTGKSLEEAQRRITSIGGTSAPTPTPTPAVTPGEREEEFVPPTTPEGIAAADAATYAGLQGYTKFFKKGGVWYGNIAGTWKTFGSREEAKQANITATQKAEKIQAGITKVAEETKALVKKVEVEGITPTPTPTPTPTVDPNEQLRQDAVDEANEIAQTIFDKIPDGDDVDMRDSTKIITDITEELEEAEEKIPAPVSMVDLFESKKTELGIEPLEIERDDLLAEKDRLQAELFVKAEEEGEKLVSTREIGRAKGALQKRFEREMMLLDVEISAVERMLSNKYSSLEMVMNLTQQDFTNATAYYTNQYNRQIQLYNILSDVEEKEYTRTEDAEKDAQINLQIITNAMSDSGKVWDDLDASLQSTIAKLEMQANLPAGVTQAFYNEYPDDEVVYETKGTDTDGREFVSFISKDKDGNYDVKKVYTGGVAGEVEGAKVKFSSDDVGRLTVAGLSTTDITSIQSYLNKGGTIDGITGLTDEQSKALNQILKGVTPTQARAEEEEKEEKAKKFLSEDWFKEKYSESTLKAQAKEWFTSLYWDKDKEEYSEELVKIARDAGYARFWKGGQGEVELYLKSDEALNYYLKEIIRGVEARREIGMSDTDILKEMK